jgi:peptidyl-prolyl cis-trans isomerase SurA
MGEFLKNKGISRAIFVTQLRSQLLWRNIVLSRVRSQVKISEVEVADVIEALQSSDTNIEVSLEQIILPIAYDVSHGEVQKLANNLYKSITEEGADFNSLAGQFSQGQALKINNINLAQLNGEVREALAGLEKGDVSKPFRSSDGYHILKLIKKQVKDNNIITEAEKDKVRQNLFMQKLELEAKKYMRDLRRAIFVETKL